MKLLMMTDLHLVAPGAEMAGVDPRVGVELCLADMQRWHGDAALCVIAGDLTDRGEVDAYRWLADRLTAFTLPVQLMMGNHDDREAMAAALPQVERDANGFLQSMRETEEGVLLFLDTYKGPTSEGAFCELRRAWLAERLESVRGRPVWIFMHHPPFPIGHTFMDRIRLDETDALALGQLLSAHDNIRHIFTGHVHRAVQTIWHGIPATCLPGTSHIMAMKRRTHGLAYPTGRPMYGIVLIEGERTTVHFETVPEEPAGQPELAAP
ncbi:MAG: phosphodiesterase [Rhizobiales bacterium]|nr:phosphodiesterase [Hyphomicrobiales bacterium]